VKLEALQKGCQKRKMLEERTQDPKNSSRKISAAEGRQFFSSLFLGRRLDLSGFMWINKKKEEGNHWGTEGKTASNRCDGRRGREEPFLGAKELTGEGAS